LATPALYYAQGGNGGPDGMDVAADGTIYVALYGEGAVGVYNSAGEELQRIAVPSQNVTSVALSADGQSLYVTEASTNDIYEITPLPSSYEARLRTDVWTWHNDNTRTGQNQDEFLLSPVSLKNNFGLLASLPVNNAVDAQPLFVYQENIAGNGSHNVVYVATENDTIYAFDADTYQLLWQSILLPVDANGNYLELPTQGIGITATPVIDRSVGPNGVLYAVTMSAEVKAPGTVHQRIHMIDLADGVEYLKTEVAAVVPGNGPCNDGTGHVHFTPGQQRERCALLLSNGTLYTSWASMEASPPYTGWMIGYDRITLQQTAVFNTNPSGLPVTAYLPDGSGCSFWNSGAGPAADDQGNIYGVTANGPFDTTLTSQGFPRNGDFGDSMIKFSTANGLTPIDYFTPCNEYALAAGDIDLGSGGIMILPDLWDADGMVHHLAMGAGKDTNLYIVDRDQMGRFNSTTNEIYQELNGALPSGMWATGAYFNGTVYYGPTGPGQALNGPLNQMVAFAFQNAWLNPQPVAAAPTLFHYPGATPSISANGNTNGIVWAVENGQSANNRVVPPIPHGLASLHAYDATNISVELYNSADPSRNGLDNIGIGNKFIVPTVANGKVFVGTSNSLAVFGLLNHPISLQSAVSCQVAASAGTNLDLPLGLTLANQTTEYRWGLPPTSGLGRDFAIVLNFSDKVDATRAKVQLVAQNGGAAQGTPSIIPNGVPSSQVVIGLLNIQDHQQLLIQLNGLTSLSPAETVPAVRLPITFQLGSGLSQ
jgi:hypothetical protein